MRGGAIVTDLVQKFSQPIQLYVLILIFLAIGFVKQIPVELRGQAGTPLGRTFLFFLTVVLAAHVSWVNGLLMAVLTLLLLSLSPRGSNEGFEPAINDSLKLVTDKKKWFVEEVLKENPVAIDKEAVKTYPIQDNTTSGASNSSTGSK